MNQQLVSLLISLFIAVIVSKFTNVNDQINKLSKNQQAILTTVAILSAILAKKFINSNVLNTVIGILLGILIINGAMQLTQKKK